MRCCYCLILEHGKTKPWSPVVVAQFSPKIRNERPPPLVGFSFVYSGTCTRPPCSPEDCYNDVPAQCIVQKGLVSIKNRLLSWSMILVSTVLSWALQTFLHTEYKRCFSFTKDSSAKHCSSHEKDFEVFFHLYFALTRAGEMFFQGDRLSSVSSQGHLNHNHLKDQ